MRSVSGQDLARSLNWADGPDHGPAYLRLASGIRLLVLDGRLPLDARLPGERDLASALHVSRTTVTAAYDALRNGGFAASRRGSGTWTTLPETTPSPALETAWAPATDYAGVDLAHAAPEAPAQVLRAAFEYALSALPRHLPGHGYHPLGLTELREAVARRFTARGLPTTVDQILVTSGAQHALSVLLTLTVGSGDRVLVEHPTYPNALDAIRRVDARPVPVAIGPDGWDVDVVAATVGQTSPRLAYLIPDFHNPTGLVATGAERAALAGVLGRSRTLTVVDETLVELGFVDPPAPFAVHEPGVVTVGTASKTFWGGLRIGWIRAERSMIAKLAAVRASIDNASPVVEQLAVAYLIEHAGQILPARRRELIERRDALLGLLAERLPEWTTRPPDGGLVLWSDLGAPVSSRLVTAAANLGVRLAAGPRFGVDGAFERRLRLPYTHPPDVLDRAVDVIAQAYRATVARPDRSLVLDTFA